MTNLESQERVVRVWLIASKFALSALKPEVPRQLHPGETRIVTTNNNTIPAPEAQKGLWKTRGRRLAFLLLWIATQQPDSQ